MSPWHPVCWGICVLLGYWFGYQAPRDVEVESTKPIQITYEVTPEAARYLVLKAVKGIETE